MIHYNQYIHDHVTKITVGNSVVSAALTTVSNIVGGKPRIAVSATQDFHKCASTQNVALGRVSINCLYDSSRNIASLQQLCAIYQYYLINYNHYDNNHTMIINFTIQYIIAIMITIILLQLYYIT